MIADRVERRTVYKKTDANRVGAVLSPSVRMTGNVPIPQRKDLKFHWNVEAEVFFLGEKRVNARFKKLQKAFWDNPVAVRQGRESWSGTKGRD